MKEMMEQKNRLAYDNGRLQSQLTQVTSQLDELKTKDTDATQNRNLYDAMQIRYEKVSAVLSSSHTVRFRALGFTTVLSVTLCQNLVPF